MVPFGCVAFDEPRWRYECVTPYGVVMVMVVAVKATVAANVLWRDDLFT